MREHLGFLKTSSVVVKIAAWIFLLSGILAGISFIFRFDSTQPAWAGYIVIAVYVFIFFFCYLIAKIADLLIKIIHEIKKEAN